jgi:hypothetical protein
MAVSKSRLLLPPDAFDEFARLASVAEHVPKVLACRDEVRAATTLRDAERRIAARLDLSRAVVATVVDASLSVLTLKRRMRVSADELVAALDASIEEQASEEWRTNFLARWKSCRASLVELLEPGHPLAALEKATDLGYASDNLLSRARLVADVRPVFDDSGQKIERNVVFFVLMLEFQSQGQTHRVDVSLDYPDVLGLGTLCDRASKKAHAIFDALSPLGPVSVVGGFEKK